MSWQTHDGVRPQYQTNDILPVSPYSTNEIEMLHIAPQAKSPDPSSSEYNRFPNGSGSIPQIDSVGGSQSSNYRLLPESYDPHHRPARWKSGFWRNFPWLGVASLMASFLCMLAAVMVLYISNGKPTSTWKVTPTVIVAILNSVFNATLAIALSQGAVISWWYRALEGGTVARLSQEWSYGNSLTSSIFSGIWALNPMAFAKIFVALAVVDSALLQRSSTVVSQTVSTTTSLNVEMSPLLPVGYSGLFTSGGDLSPPSLTGVTPDFSKVISDYQKNNPITSGVTGCAGSCSTIIQAAGLAITCADPVATDYIVDPTKNDGSTTFSVSSGFAFVGCVGAEYSDGKGSCLTYPVMGTNGSHDQLSLNVGYSSLLNASSGSCNGYFINQTCTMVEAVVEYNVNINSNIMTLNNPTSQLKVVASSNRTLRILDAPDEGANVNSTLAGFQLLSGSMFDSSVIWNFQAETLYSLEGVSIFASQYLQNEQAEVTNCAYIWSDPLDDILTAYNELMFRSAIRSSNLTTNFTLPLPNGSTSTFTTKNTVPAATTFTQNIFVTHFQFLTLAAAIMTSVILAVIPTFYGFWHLGRSVSFDPIEIAKAFDAPMLAGDNTLSDEDAEGLLKRVGHREVLFGETVLANEKGENMLVMGVPTPSDLSR